jgi:hypothetical protein
MDWRMSELKNRGILNLKTFIVKNTTVNHTWGAIEAAEDTLVHNGVTFPIKDEVIKLKLQ